MGTANPRRMFLKQVIGRSEPTNVNYFTLGFVLQGTVGLVTSLFGISIKPTKEDSPDNSGLGWTISLR
jgi:hypothetical protein